VKFRENSNFGSRSSKVIDLGANLKHICHFLLVISGNYVLISYRWTNYDARWLIGRVFRQDGAFWVSLWWKIMFTDQYLKHVNYVVF